MTPRLPDSIAVAIPRHLVFNRRLKRRRHWGVFHQCRAHFGSPYRGIRMVSQSGIAPQPLQEAAERPKEVYIQPRQGLKRFAGKEWLLFLLFIAPNFFFLIL